MAGGVIIQTVTMANLADLEATAALVLVVAAAAAVVMIMIFTQKMKMALVEQEEPVVSSVEMEAQVILEVQRD
jgi:archaellin